MCGLTHVTAAALCSSCSLLFILNSDWATENEAGRSVRVNGNEKPCWRDMSPIEFSCNCNYSLITHNKTPVHSTWGLLRVCAACPTPRLNLSSKLHPLQTISNISVRSPLGLHRIQQFEIHGIWVVWQRGCHASWSTDDQDKRQQFHSTHYKDWGLSMLQRQLHCFKDSASGGHQLSCTSTRQRCCM